jgi:hypothetical protein
MNKKAMMRPADADQLKSTAVRPVELIHISWAGPERWLSCGGKHWVVEDHHYCGPIVLTPKTGDPAKNQPSESSLFWQHVNAWYAQGKRTKAIGGKVWCVYETQMHEARRHGRVSKNPNVK